MKPDYFTQLPKPGDRIIWVGKERTVSKVWARTRWVYFTDGTSARHSAKMQPTAT